MAGCGATRHCKAVFPDTMSINIKLFARFREQYRLDETTVTPDGPVTAAALWQQVVGEPLPDSALVAINMEYVAPDAPVADGDEVAFFPPVTGG